MSTAEHEAVVRRVAALASQGHLDAAAALLAPDYRDHSDPPGTPPGPESAKQRWALLGSAFPDARVTLDEVIAEGDRVAVRFTFRGTQQGAFLGIPATGRPVAVSGMDINRIADGQFVERWAVFDTLSLLQQLGVIPAPGQVKEAARRETNGR